MPVELMVAVLKVEGGEVGKAYPRAHGTYFGPGQISDKWLPTFAKWNITASMLQHDACANIGATGYVLAYYKVREPDWLRATARFNTGSLSTDVQVQAGTRYAKKVLAQWESIYQKWGRSSYATQQ